VGVTIQVTYGPGSPIAIDFFPGHGGGVSGKGTANIDAIITNITDQLNFTFDSANWPGAPNQQNIELLSGGIQSVDDTSNFTSIFTPDGAGTGCIPEPASLALLTSGLVGLWTIRRRKAV